MNYCLVVVDMQPVFEAANCRKTIKRIKGLIGLAKKHDANIVILEYNGYPRTHQSILDLVKLYAKATVTGKSFDDGSESVARVTAGLQIDEFILCGVNTSVCVKATAVGLKDLFPNQNVYVSLKACNQPKEWEDTYEWTRRSSLKNFFENNGVMC